MSAFSAVSLVIFVASLIAGVVYFVHRSVSGEANIRIAESNDAARAAHEAAMEAAAADQRQARETALAKKADAAGSAADAAAVLRDATDDTAYN